MANKNLKSGSNYFLYNASGCSLVSDPTLSSVISAVETPDIVPGFINYADNQFRSQDFEAVDAPTEEAQANSGNPSHPPLTHLPH